MTAFVSTNDIAERYGCDRADVAYWCSIGLLKALPRATRFQPWRIDINELERLDQEGLPPSRRTLERK